MAELVIFKTVLNLKKRAIFVLPFVSLVIEKEKHFKRMINIFNRGQPYDQRIKIRGFYGDQVIKSRSYKENILICTIEKANGILNSLIQRGETSHSEDYITRLLTPVSPGYGHTIGCVLLDEMHVLGNTFNGYLLEILIR